MPQPHETVSEKKHKCDAYTVPWDPETLEIADAYEKNGKLFLFTE
jgi:hypothetical protein